MFNTLILIHEIGHLLMALFLDWKIEKIIILPFGGLTIFNNSLDKPLFEELLILITGPIFQIIFYYIWQSISYNELLVMYNWGILLFNVLPIYPLDGSKILNLLLLRFFPFITSNLITLYSSIFIIVINIILIINYNFNLMLMIIFLFLLLKIINEIKLINFNFNYLILEKLKNNRHYKKKRVIMGNEIKNIYRNCSHLFYFNNKYHLEKEILCKRFDFTIKV